MVTKTSKKVYFKVIKNKRLMNAPLEEMELSQRAHNALRRIGIDTVGGLVEMLEILRTEDCLPELGRNLGRTTAHEIMWKLWDFNKKLRGDEDAQDDYVDETLGMQEQLKAEMNDFDKELAKVECKARLDVLKARKEASKKAIEGAKAAAKTETADKDNNNTKNI